MPVAAFPLLIAAIGFGFRGALYAILVGALPVMFIGGDYPGGIRLAIVVAAVGGVRTLDPRLPSYLVTLCTWVLLVMPLRHFFYPYGNYPVGAMATKFWEHHLLLSGLSDVLLTLVSGAFMLNPSFWCFVTRRPYKANVYFLMTHVLTLTSLLSVLAVIATFNRLGIFAQNRFLDTNLWAAFGLFTTFVVIPSLIAFRLSLLATKQFGDSLLAGPLRALEESSEFAADWEEEFGEGLSKSLSVPLEQLGPDANKLGVCAVDEDGSVLFINDQFRAAANIVLPGAVGRNIATLAGETPLVADIQRLLENTPPERELIAECKISAGKGKFKYFEVALRQRAAGNNDSERTPRVITVRDITERRTVERRLLESERMRSLATFIKSASRTLTDYCTTITGKASQSLISSNTSEWKESVQLVNQAAQNAGRLAAQLLDFASDSSTSTITTIDMRDLVRDNVNLLQDIAGEKNTVVLETQATEGWTKVDPQLVMQALLAIVANSREAYGSRHGTIKVSILSEKIDQLVAHLHPGTQPGAFIRVRITDSGEGMPLEVLSRATDPLFSTKHDEGHSGLGLSTVFAIMRELDGFMTLESKPKGGTSVSLYFPLAEQPTLSPHSFDEASEPPQTLPRGNGSVVIVEKSDDFREVLYDMVSSLGYQVTSCRNSSEAEELLRTKTCDILVLDDELPLQDGASLLRRLKAEYDGVKTVLLATSLRSSPSGSDTILQKPFDLTRLAQVLDSVAHQGTGRRQPQPASDEVSV
jgi:signal transduction histidine kinase/CheY-like chemotaxis protein